MDTTIETSDRADDRIVPPRRVGITRTLFLAALLSFTLPFLTVTCVGDGVTVHGVQAATKFDPGSADQAERELTRDEPANLFAMIALGAVVVGLALSFGSRRSRVELAAAGAVAVIALEGLFAYAFFRSWGEAFPEIGFAAAIVLLLGASWAAVGRVPRWLFGVGGIVAAGLTITAAVSIETIMNSPWLFIWFTASGIVAVALAVGAMRVSVQLSGGSARPAGQPRIVRMVAAGTIGVLLLGAAGVAAVLLMSEMLSAESAPPAVGTSVGFTLLVLGLFVGASVAAWATGDAIVRHERRAPALAATAAA
jgi:hypothetical protein